MPADQSSASSSSLMSKARASAAPSYSVSRSTFTKAFESLAVSVAVEKFAETRTHLGIGEDSPNVSLEISARQDPLRGSEHQLAFAIDPILNRHT